jgi:primary-amine oxidase
VALLLISIALPCFASHMFVPLSAEEHTIVFDLTRAHFAAESSLPDDGLLFPFISLREPSKTVALGDGDVIVFQRAATVHVFHPMTNRLWVVTVDLTTGRVTSVVAAPAGTQPAVTAEEYVAAEEIVRAYEPWAAAMRTRGVEPDDVYIDVWAPGDQPLPPAIVATLPHGSNTRLLRALSFFRGASVDEYDAANPQNPYVRPIEGVVVTIDMNEGRVVHMTNTLVRPVSRESGSAPSRRTGLKPMRVVQPDGGSFEVTGRLVKWQNWQFYAFLHPREGLVLYDVRYNDNGTLRRIAYRLSLSEIYVPYGVADENWSWRTAFDVGEYNLGMYAQTLEPNRDVPEHAFFFDTNFGTDTGETFEATDTVAMYERDNGILWTRTDPSLVARDTRARRELVVTWNAWIGNYIYGFDWIFGMDGGIEVKVALTGTLLTRGAPDEEEATAPLVGEDESGARVSAPNHQHFFSFRLDLDVDGTQNSVVETNVRHLPTPGFANAFGPVETPIAKEGFRDADPIQARHWEVENPATHAAYAIESHHVAKPLSSPLYEPLMRAAFANHALWVTRYREDELYAAGDFPNQGALGEGLQSFIANDETTENTDVVVWHTIGLTHVPRPEDYPVMPTETIGFKIVPHGFFAKNPALDVPDLPKPRGRRRTVR